MGTPENPRHTAKAFALPVYFRDGRVLRTLADATYFLFTLSDDQIARPVWKQAVELTYQAAMTGRKTDIEKARRQFRRALVTENWLAPT